jgi:hypothetical protein
MLSKINAPDGINSMLRSTLAVEMPGLRCRSSRC